MTPHQLPASRPLNGQRIISGLRRGGRLIGLFFLYAEGDDQVVAGFA